MALALLLFATAVFTAFTAFVGFKYGVQSSISASIHKLTGAFEKSLYSFFILGVAIPMMVVSNTVLGWWAGALLAIDFAAVSGGDKLQSFLHGFGAQAGMALGIIMLAVDFHLWPISVGFVLFSLFAVWKMKNSTWWIETAAFIAVIGGLFIAKIL